MVPLEETMLSSSCYNLPAKVFDLKQSDHHLDAKKSILTSLTSTNYEPLVQMMCFGIRLAFTLTLLWSFQPLCFELMCSFIATKADAVNELKKEIREMKREMKESMIEMRKSGRELCKWKREMRELRIEMRELKSLQLEAIDSKDDNSINTECSDRRN